MFSHVLAEWKWYRLGFTALLTGSEILAITHESSTCLPKRFPKPNVDFGFSETILGYGKPKQSKTCVFFWGGVKNCLLLWQAKFVLKLDLTNNILCRCTSVQLFISNTCMHFFMDHYMLINSWCMKKHTTSTTVTFAKRNVHTKEYQGYKWRIDKTSK